MASYWETSFFRHNGQISESRMQIFNCALRLGAFCGAVALPFASLAQPGIPAGYDGYALVPGPSRASPSYYLLLSQEQCPAKSAPKGWKKGAYLYKTELEPACWTVATSDVKMCPRGQYETVFKQTDYGSTTTIPCHLWPLENFYEVRR